MDLFAFILFLIVLQTICVYIGGKSSKDIQNQDDYFSAGKKTSFFPLMMTFLATQVGGGIILGSAEEAYQYGWVVLLYPLGYSLGLISLGLGVGQKLKQLEISTIAQIFETFYRSATLKKIASALSIFSLFMILTAQIIASNKFMISLGVDDRVWFIGFWGLVILYTAVGGLKAVIATDVVQAGFFVCAFLICFVFAVTQLESSTLDLVDFGLANDNFAFNSSKLSGWMLMPLLFMTVEQSMGQRCFAAKTAKIISRATISAAACAFLMGIIPVFFGILAKYAGIEIVPGASVLMVIIQQATNPIVAALAGCAILAAIISTGDSLINAIGSNLSQDFSFSQKKKGLRISQAMSVVISISALFFSFYFDSVVSVLIQSYELSVSCLFIPVMFALFKKEGSRISASLSIICGAAGFIVFKAVNINLPSEIVNLFLSLSGYCAGEVYVWLKVQVMERRKNLLSCSNIKGF